MEILIQLHDLGFFFAGMALGYGLKSLLISKVGEKIEKTIFGFVVVFAWLYANIFLQVGDWWLNVFMGLVLVQLFDVSKLKELIMVRK